MKKSEFRILVRRRLDGKASEEEKRFLDAYDHLFDTEQSQVPVYTPEDVKKKYSEVKERIHKLRAQRGIVIVLRRYPIAASLLLAMTIGLLIVGQQQLNKAYFHAPEYRVYSTPYRKIARVTLPDSTHVTLNAGSTLKYPVVFGKDRREVSLNGEAYFEVAHDRAKPFIVHTDKMQVQVLGTVFNVRGFADEATQEVSVSSGRVAVQRSREQQRAKAILNAHEAVRYRKMTDDFERFVPDPAAIGSWKEGKLFFRGEPLYQVAKSLERYYGVRLTVPAALKNTAIDVYIDGPLLPALKGIAEAVGANLYGGQDSYSFYISRGEK